MEIAATGKTVLGLNQGATTAKTTLYRRVSWFRLRTYEKIIPATEEVIDVAADAGPEDIERAVMRLALDVAGLFDRISRPSTRPRNLVERSDLPWRTRALQMI